MEGLALKIKPVIALTTTSLNKPTSSELIMTNIDYCGVGDLVQIMKDRIIFLNSAGSVDLPEDIKDSILEALNSDINKLENLLRGNL